jgi:predicted AAA+ superfamily ATPase
MDERGTLVRRVEALVTRLEELVAPAVPEVDWSRSIAFRWVRHRNGGVLRPVLNPHHIAADDLKGIDEQKQVVEQNSRQFVAGHPANNVLLTGARGTGKSSLVKALLTKYARKGLRLIEVGKHDLLDLPEIVEQVAARPERFIVFCDDLSFSAEEPGYQALKAVLDGSVSAPSDNVLVYATSNRRHLMPEYMVENLEAHRVGEEIHPGESVEEKVSLSERFGIWVSFYPFSQEDYLRIVNHWLQRLGVHEAGSAGVEHAALQWALARGSRSGRVALQFARDWAGSRRLKKRR